MITQSGAAPVTVVKTVVTAVETITVAGGGTPTGEQLMASAAYKKGKEEGLAAALGIPSSRVTVTGFIVAAVRRELLNDGGEERQLTAVQVSVTTHFEIKSTSTADADALVTQLAEPTLAAKIKEKTELKMAAQDWSSSTSGAIASAPTMATPTVAPATTQTSDDSTSSSVGLSAKVGAVVLAVVALLW